MSSDLQVQYPGMMHGAVGAPKGLTIIRRFTREGHDPFASVEYGLRSSISRDEKGTIISQIDAIEMPKMWSQEAVDVVAQQFFYKTGVPQKNLDGAPQLHADGTYVLGAETSIKQVVHRLAGAWRAWGEKYNYFAAPKDAQAFYDETVYMMLTQMVSPGAALWAHVGLQWAYGVPQDAVNTEHVESELLSVDADHPEIEEFVRAAGTTVCATNAFIEAALEDREWNLRARTDGHVSKTLQGRALWNTLCGGVLQTGKPGLQFDTTCNEWHTAPKSGRISAQSGAPEFLFLESATAPRATINLAHFFDIKTMVFDIDSFRHASRLWTVVLDISVLIAQAAAPVQESMNVTADFRPLGLGFTNLAAGVLMAAGVPYDSRDARAIAGAITAIMTGESYAISAEMAKYVGAFAKFDLNRSDMLRVVRNHRRAAYNAPPEEYEKLSIKPRGIESTQCPVYLVKAARSSWDRALELGEIYGYRNAQTTVIAGPNNANVQLDSATCGIEPENTQVVFKKIAGDSFVRTVSDGVIRGLRTLNYTSPQIEEIVRFIRGTNTFAGCPHVNQTALGYKGFTKDDIDRLEQQLSGVFELKFAFNVWTLGEETLRRLGFEPQQYNSLEFNLLSAIGFSDDQIVEANEYVCGTSTIEGAPFVKPDHYAVFDCARRCGKKGIRAIPHLAHVRMMASVQPFLSGAIAKTIVLPPEATVGDVGELFIEAWRHGLKSVSVRREGTDIAVQAVATVSLTPIIELIFEPEFISMESLNDNSFNMAPEPAPVVQQGTDPHAGLYSAHVPAQAVGLEFGQRRALPAKRSGITVETKVGNQQVYLRTGEYPDGTLGEIFIDMYREGAAFRSVLNCFAISVSLGLQHGVPLEKFVEKFTFTRFEPSGFTTHPNVKMCTSIVDYIFRVLAVEYLGRMDLAQVPPEISELSPAAAAMAAPHDVSAHSALIAEPQGDAPLCDTCGHTTIRSGLCYKCLNCGASMGCN